MLSSTVPAGTLLYLREHTCPYPFASLCLTHVVVFFACLSAQSRAAADKLASLLSAPARFTATCLPNPELPELGCLSHKGL